MIHSDVICTIQYKDNYLKYLPHLFFLSINNPIVLVQDFNNSKHVYRAYEWRILRRTTFPPPVLDMTEF
jgi:hypothetical protein